MSDTDGKRSVQGSHLNINTREEFGHQLTALREQARLTVRDVARRIDVPPATLGGYFAGRHLPPLKPPNLLRDLLRACGVTDQAEIEQWEATLRRIRRVPGKRPSGAPVPYRGLESFQPEDAEWFYGREDLTDLLVKRLVEVSGSGQVMIVVGPSGSGKSSLLRAGVISAVRQGSVEGPDPDVGAHLLFTPGGEPLAEFAQHLAALPNADVNGVRSRLHEDPRSVVDLIRGPAVVQAEAETDGTRSGALLIVVDQFEEVFTACSDPRERQAFLTALWAAAEPDACGGELGEGQSPDDPKPAALVVLGLRADFYDRALRYPQLAAALQEAQVVVGPMTEPQLRRAIVEPAHRANSDIEDGLVEVLLRDLAPTGDRAAEAAHDPGSLPLLSHALLATWERGHRRRLTTAGYKETGGIRGAVARTAEDAYRALSGEQRDIARQIFLRLVHVSDDVADTRRRTNRSELSFQNPGAQFVLDQFVSQRLVTVDEDRVEISHEALLAAWPRLREWIDADRAGLRTHRQLTVAAEAWHDAGRDRHALYRAGRLATAREWAAEPAHLAALNQLEQEFFDASVAYDLAEAQVARRRTRVLLQLVAALAVLTLAAGALAVTAFQQRTAANHQRDLALSRQLATVADQLRPTDVSLAMQLSLAAYRIAPTPEARSSLLESYIPPAVTRVIGRAGVMQSVTTTPDRRTLVTAGPDFQIHLLGL